SFVRLPMRLLGLVAVSALALALPASCAPLTATSLPAGPGDAGDAGLSGPDASGGSSGSGGGPDSGACTPGDVATYQPVYHPAAVTGRCTDMQQIMDYFEACFGDQKSTTRCNAFQGQSANITCASCVVT